MQLAENSIQEELGLIRETARRFIAGEITAKADTWRRQKHVDREVWRKAGQLGLLLADIPEEFGGGGGSFRHQAVIFEELAKAGDVAFGLHVHAIVAQYLLRQGSEWQKSTYLPRLARGEMVGAIAMTEPGAGSDLQGIATRAVATAGGYILNGSKTFISNGYLADLLLVVAKTDPSQRAKGTSIFLLETRKADGFRVGRLLDKIGQEGQDTCELFLDDVCLRDEHLLGEVPGRGFIQLMEELPYERTILALTAIGMIERAVALTVEHTRLRQAFGKPLLEMQNTRFRLAEAQTIARIGRVFIDHCVAEISAGKRDPVLASMAKWWATDMQNMVMDQCLQFFGGYGYMREYPIAQMYVDARVQKIYGGANEVMKELIARSL